jgi:hypothetical protein
MFSRRVVGLLVVLVLCTPAVAPALVTQLYSSSELNPSDITIGFDDGSDYDVANVRYQVSDGVTFSRDDGKDVYLFDWQGRGLDTTSLPNVLATVGAEALPESDSPAPGPVPHLNVSFLSPMTEIGAYFGNDAGGGFTEMTLSIFDQSSSTWLSVLVTPNENFSVDQFIGLRSDIPFTLARFEHNASWLPIVIDDLSFSNVTPTVVPVPSAVLLGCIGIATVRWLRKRKSL